MLLRSTADGRLLEVQTRAVPVVLSSYFSKIRSENQLFRRIARNQGLQTHPFITLLLILTRAGIPYRNVSAMQ